MRRRRAQVGATDGVLAKDGGPRLFCRARCQVAHLQLLEAVHHDFLARLGPSVTPRQLFFAALILTARWLMVPSSATTLTMSPCCRA